MGGDKHLKRKKVTLRRYSTSETEPQTTEIQPDDDSQSSVTSISELPEKNVSQEENYENNEKKIDFPAEKQESSKREDIENYEDLPCETRNLLIKYCISSQSVKPQLEALQACDTSIIGGFKKEDLLTKINSISTLERTRSISENTEMNSPTPSLYDEDYLLSTDDEDCQLGTRAFNNKGLAENVRTLMQMFDLKNRSNILWMPRKNKPSYVDEKIPDAPTKIINSETDPSSLFSETEEKETLSISPSRSSEREEMETERISALKVSETVQCIETEEFEAKISKENVEKSKNFPPSPKPFKSNFGKIVKPEDAELVDSQYSIFYNFEDMQKILSSAEEFEPLNFERTNKMDKELIGGSQYTVPCSFETFSKTSFQNLESATEIKSSEIISSEVAGESKSLPSALETKTLENNSGVIPDSQYLRLKDSKKDLNQNLFYASPEKKTAEFEIAHFEEKSPEKLNYFGFKWDNSEFVPDAHYSIFRNLKDIDNVAIENTTKVLNDINGYGEIFQENIDKSDTLPSFVKVTEPMCSFGRSVNFDLIPDSQELFSDCFCFEKKLAETQTVSLTEKGQFENSRKKHLENPETFLNPSPMITSTRYIFPSNELFTDKDISRNVESVSYAKTPDVSPSANPFSKRKKVLETAELLLSEADVSSSPKMKQVIDLENLAIISKKINERLMINKRLQHKATNSDEYLTSKLRKYSRSNETSPKKILILNLEKTDELADVDVTRLRKYLDISRKRCSLSQLNKVKEFLHPIHPRKMHEFPSRTRDIWSIIINEPSEDVRLGLLEYRNYIECILMWAMAPFEPITYSEFLPQFMNSIKKLSYHPDTDILEAHTYVEDLSALFKQQLLEKHRGVKYWACISNDIQRLKHIQESLDRYEEIKANDDISNEMTFESAVMSATRQLLISDVKFKLISRDKYRMVVRKLPVAKYGNVENLYLSDYYYEYSRLTVKNLLALHPRSDELLDAIETAHRILFDHSPYKIYFNAFEAYFNNVLLKILIRDT